MTSARRVSHLFRLLAGFVDALRAPEEMRAQE